MENALILEKEKRIAVSTPKAKRTKSKRNKSYYYLMPLFIYLPFLGTCMALAFGKIFVLAIVLFVLGNMAFLWFYLVHQSSKIDIYINLDAETGLEQEWLENQLYDRSNRNS